MRTVQIVETRKQLGRGMRINQATILGAGKPTKVQRKRNKRAEQRHRQKMVVEYGERIAQGKPLFVVFDASRISSIIKRCRELDKKSSLPT